jgi:hypothetical protein
MTGLSGSAAAHKSMIRVLFLGFFMLCRHVVGVEWHAAADASLSGNGSLTNPWPLGLALTKSSVIKPGDTLYLRGGNYRGPGFVSTLAGTANNYVTVRSYPGEWAVVTDGTMGVLGANLYASSTNALNVPIAGFEMLSVSPNFLIGSELLYVVGRTGTNWNLVRGWGGTTISAHSLGERVIMVMPILQQNGSYVKFQDFEITSLLSTNRNVGTNWTLASGLDLSANGRGNKAINLVIHDTGHPGIGFWKQGDGGEINGCLIWGIGMYDFDPNFAGGVGTPRGSGVYSQNESGGLATIKNTISFRNFTSGGKVYGESGPVLNFQFVSNIVFQCNPSLEGSSGSTSTSNLWFNGNVMMGTPMLSYVSLSNRAQYFINNTLVAGNFGVSEHNNSFYTNNTVFMIPGAGNGGSAIGYSSVFYSKADLKNVWNWNTYYLGAGTSPYNFYFATKDVKPANAAGGGTLRYFDGTNGWPNWSSYDANSTYALNWPTNYLKVSAQISDYDTNRWHIAVVSTSGQSSTPITLSDYGFAVGERYELIDVQNWPVLIASGTYAGSNISLPLRLTNVSTINGAINHYANEHTNVKYPGLFNAFVLTRKPSIAPPRNLRVP